MIAVLFFFQSCDQPIGYPIFVSELAYSFTPPVVTRSPRVALRDLVGLCFPGLRGKPKRDNELEVHLQYPEELPSESDDSQDSQAPPHALDDDDDNDDDDDGDADRKDRARAVGTPPGQVASTSIAEMLRHVDTEVSDVLQGDSPEPLSAALLAESDLATFESLPHEPSTGDELELEATTPIPARSGGEPSPPADTHIRFYV